MTSRADFAPALRFQSGTSDSRSRRIDVLEARRQQNESGLDRNAFAIFWLLRQEGASEARPLAIEIDRLFGQFPNFDANVQERRSLKAKVYKLLLPAVGKERMVPLVERIISLGRK